MGAAVIGAVAAALAAAVVLVVLAVAVLEEAAQAAIGSPKRLQLLWNQKSKSRIL